jgi:hypothetical protein
MIQLLVGVLMAGVKKLPFSGIAEDTVFVAHRQPLCVRICLWSFSICFSLLCDFVCFLICVSAVYGTAESFKSSGGWWERSDFLHLVDIASLCYQLSSALKQQRSTPPSSSAAPAADFPPPDAMMESVDSVIDLIMSSPDASPVCCSLLSRVVCIFLFVRCS